MVSDTFEQCLRGLSERTPFQPFTVELVSGARFTVDHPEALVFRAGLAVFINHAGMPTLFEHEGVSRLDGAADPESTKAA